MTARDEAIEAGAKAMFEHCSPGAVKPWERRALAYRQVFLAEAELVYDAMAPLIRQACAEEIGDALQERSGIRPSSWAAAAEIAREIGGAS